MPWPLYSWRVAGDANSAMGCRSGSITAMAGGAEAVSAVLACRDSTLKCPLLRNLLLVNLLVLHRLIQLFWQLTSQAAMVQQRARLRHMQGNPRSHRAVIQLHVIVSAPLSCMLLSVPHQAVCPCAAGSSWPWEAPTMQCSCTCGKPVVPGPRSAR